MAVALLSPNFRKLVRNSTNTAIYTHKRVTHYNKVSYIYANTSHSIITEPFTELIPYYKEDRKGQLTKLTL